LDLPRICYSLALVLGLVVLLRWGARWVFPSTMMARRSGAIRLLARTPLGPKQQVMLIAVGRRVLVVADNGQQMTRLTEITESEEISGLTADLAQARVAHEAEKDHEEAERAFAHELNEAAAADQLEKPAGASIPATALALKPALPAPSPVSPLPAAADHPAARLAAKLFDRMRAPKSAEAAPPGPPASSPKLPQTDAQPKMTPEFQATLFATEQEQSNRTKGDGLGDLAQRIRAMSRQFNRK
jgi:flagellar biogenesis protein FliO